MSGPKFEELEHTADVGLRIYGHDLPQLLANAAEGMFSLIGATSFTEAELETRAVDLRFDDSAGCLYQWLRALLREFNRDGFFPVGTALDLRAGRLKATVRGGRFDPQRHEFFAELKAVTQHALTVRERADGGLEAEVIFDV